MKRVNWGVSILLTLFMTLSFISVYPLSVYAGINTYDSDIVVTTPSAAVVAAASENADGVELTASIVFFAGGWDGLYIASNRAAADYFYYKDPASGSWLSLAAYKGFSGYDSVYAIEESMTSAISATSRALNIKVVSIVAGTSKIAFGTDPKDVYDYSRGVTPDNGLANIIRQRRWDAVFTAGAAGGFKISYNANVGAGIMLDDFVSSGGNYTIKDNAFIRSDHSFAGWNTAADGSGAPYASNATINNVQNNITLYAQWVYTGGGGGAYVGISVTLSEVAEPAGSVRATTKPAAERVNEEGAVFQVTLVSANGEAFSDANFKLWVASSRSSPDVFFIKINETWRPLTDLTGQTYTGWLTGIKAYNILLSETTKITDTTRSLELKVVSSAAGNSLIVFGVEPNDVARYAGGNTPEGGYGNIIQYRKWVASFSNPNVVITRVISFNANKGTGFMPDGSAPVGGNYTIPTNAFTRDGYNFTGWNTAEDSSKGTAYAAGATIANIQSDITLYAQWSLITGGGGGSSSSSGGGGGGGGPATITGGNGTIPLMYTLNSGVVELFMLDKEVNDIIDTTINKISVFDVSRVPNFARVRTPKTGLEKLIDEGDGLSIQLKTPKGTLSFDNGSLKSIISQSGPYITFSLTEVKYDNLSAAQKAAVNPDNLIVNIAVSSGAKVIRDFDGVLNVFIPYEGPLPAKAWYLSDAGALEEMTASYIETTKTLWFKTNHLSLYVIGKEIVASGTRIRLAIGSLSYTVGGVAKKLDAAPAIVNERTMVPLRFIAEALGAKVDWDAGSRTAAVALGGKSLSVTIDKIAAGMDVPAMIINDRTMVPLRYVGEALGCDVAWNPDTRAIDISK